MKNDQRTDNARAASRDHDVRAHERAQYATPPTHPPTGPTGTTTPGLESAGLSRSADTREEPRQTDDHFDPTAPGRWLVAIRHTPIDGTVTVLSYANHVNTVLRRRPWAVFVRDVGWTFPARYLEHVEKLLDAAEVDLFDVDGTPTPRRRRELAETENSDSRTTLSEIRAKRDWCQAHTAEIEHARREARRAFAQAVAASPTIDHTGNEAVS